MKDFWTWVLIDEIIINISLIVGDKREIVIITPIWKNRRFNIPSHKLPLFRNLVFQRRFLSYPSLYSRREYFVSLNHSDSRWFTTYLLLINILQMQRVLEMLPVIMCWYGELIARIYILPIGISEVPAHEVHVIFIVHQYKHLNNNKRSEFNQVVEHERTTCTWDGSP